MGSPAGSSAREVWLLCWACSLPLGLAKHKRRRLPSPCTLRLTKGWERENFLLRGLAGLGARARGRLLVFVVPKNNGWLCLHSWGLLAGRQTRPL